MGISESGLVVDIHPIKGSANDYFYQHHTGQIVFCITPYPPVIGTDRRETSVFLPQVARRLLGIMPRLRNLKVRRTWRGLFPMTPDGVPIVGTVVGLRVYNIVSHLLDGEPESRKIDVLR